MVEQLYKSFVQSSGVSTDTRSITANEIFFALRGPNFNANEKATEAIAKGARLAVIDDPQYALADKTMLVPDALSMLQTLANHHRQQYQIPVLALTGSNGKTTTKELLDAVLSRKYNTIATIGNLNNHIGVPLTLLRIDASTELAIVEMGANHVGDIALLCNIAEPTHGLITNIGKAHIGTFGGAEGILRGKSELYDFLLKTNGQVFINQHQPKLMNMARRFESPVLYPDAGSHHHCELLSAEPFVKIRVADGTELNTQIAGSYNFDNIATALCVGDFFNVPPAEAYQALSAYTPANNRSQILHKNGNIIILDAYNANPSSMEKAIENLTTIPGAKKGVILGDMFELGDDTVPEHKQVGQWVKAALFDLAIFCGEAMRHAFDEVPGALHFTTRDELMRYLSENKIENHTLLIKGSRGMALEKVLDNL